MKFSEVKNFIEKNIPEDKIVYGTKLLLAGAESKKVRDDFVRIGIRNILVSYYYLREKSNIEDLDALRDDFSRFDFVFMDSGGFTLIMQSVKSEESGEEVDKIERKKLIENYAMEYYSFISDTKDMWNACAEVDAINDLDRSWMEEKKDKLWELGVPIVPVLQGEPISEIEERGWWDKYPYIAIGSAIHPESKNKEDAKRFHEYMRIAREKEIAIHGFAMTTAPLMNRAEFFSADSTTWLSGAKYGNTQIFQNGRIRVYDHHNKHERKRFKNILVANGIIWEKIEAEVASEVNIMNAFFWKQYADDVGKRIQNAYWRTKEELDDFRDKLRDQNKDIILAQERPDAVKPVLHSDDMRLDVTLVCNSCYVYENCPYYEKGARCKFKSGELIDTPDKMFNAFQSIITLQMDRIIRASMMEKLNNGVLDKQLTQEMSVLMKMMETAKLLSEKNTGNSIMIQAKGDVPTESIVQKIFGNLPGFKEKTLGISNEDTN